MGNSHVHAQEKGGDSVFDTFKKKIGQDVGAAGDAASVQSTVAKDESQGASAGTSTGASLSANSLPGDDPTRIESSLPPFPGTWGEMHKVKEIFPQPFDGVKAVFNKGMSRYFHVNHSFSLGTMTPSCYKFGATYVGSKQLSLTESFPVLLGEMDPKGNLTAQCIHAFTKNTRSRFFGQYQSGDWQAVELGTDYRGSFNTLSLTLANPDPLSLSGVAVAQYLHAVHSNVALGAEVMGQRGLNPLQGQMMQAVTFSLGAKYSDDKVNAGIQLSPLDLGLHASYCRKLDNTKTVGAEINGKVPAGECTATVGYSFEIPQAESTFKASIDTNLTIQSTVEKKMTPLPMTLTLCCQGNLKKAQYICGIGLTTG